MRSVLITALLVAGPALATPAQDAKATLGGVILKTVVKKIGGSDYILALQSPHKDGLIRAHLLKSFAGKYTVIWSSKDDYSGFGTFKGILDHDLTDINRDGKPEVYLASISYGNAFGAESYDVFDVLNKKKYSVGVSFQPEAGNGSIEVPDFMHQAAAAPFLKYLEPRVAKSENLKDSRGLSQKVWSKWHEEYDSFFEQETYNKPMPVKVTWLPLTHPICKLDGSVTYISPIQNIEYRSYFRFGLMAFDKKLKSCALLFAFQDHDALTAQRVTGNEIQMSWMDSSIIGFNVTNNTVRWVKK